MGVNVLGQDIPTELPCDECGEIVTRRNGLIYGDVICEVDGEWKYSWEVDEVDTVTDTDAEYSAICDSCFKEKYGDID